MLSVAGLARDMGLELLAGGEAGDTPVRWVHATELEDPTPWLSGGELVLTTGIQLATPGRQRAWVERLAAHHLAGVGFGTGFGHDDVPETVLARARELSFPVFEVPFDLPFIAITEKAFGRLVNDQYEVLQRGIAMHKRLERIVIEERGLPEVVRALSAAIGGAVLVLDGRGAALASAAFRRPWPPGALEDLRDEIVRRGAPGARANGDGPGPVAFAPQHPEVYGRSLALPVVTRAGAVPQAWLAATREGQGLGDFERLILQQAVTVVALELMRRRVVRETEHRLAGDLLAGALSGRVGAEELEGRLLPFGVGATAAVLVFDARGAAEAEALLGELDRALVDLGVRALVTRHEHLACAVVDAGALDPVEVAARVQERLPAPGRAAASRPAPVAALKRSFHEARCALEASALGPGAAPTVASYRDLGAFQLLLSLQDEHALRLYCDSLLGPLDRAGERAGGLDPGDLMRSLEVFIEENGQWERAARRLFCHRHTLRYRMRRIEELTGRDLARAKDRIELWLALRGRELVR
jgi:purine catabolism regulator